MRVLVPGAVAMLCAALPFKAAHAQCQAYGADTGCGTIITITATGTTVTATGMGPYDGSDDTLVGVVNNIPACTGPKSTSACGLPIYSLTLTSTNTIFGFDGDGIDTYGAPGNSMDGTGYGGPNAYFTNINSNQTVGRVNFTPPIQPGKTAYFSLENALNSVSPCTALLNNSLKGAVGGGIAVKAPPVGNSPSTDLPLGQSGQKLGISATFVPTTVNGTTYTVAQAAQACGFVEFDWQQTVTSLPGPAIAFAACAPATPLVPPFNDPPLCGYTYQHPPNAVGIPTYWNVYTASTDPYSVAANATANYLSFYDQPNDPVLPAGTAISFTTHLVGILGPAPTYTVVDTGVGFTWTSNHAGATGGTAIVQSGPNLPPDTSGTGGVTVTSINQISTYSGVAVSAINGSSNIFGASPLLSAILPESRSAQPGGTVTAFATIINTGTTTVSGCSIAPTNGLTGTFVYQTTDPTTNALTGTANTPISIAGNNASQSFVIAFTPSAVIAPMNVGFNFSCTNVAPAPITTGVDTLLLSASTTTATPDVVALGATISNDGILHIPGPSGSYSFAVATVNLGSGDTITATATTNGETLPVTITICQTSPTTGGCLAPASASVSTTIASHATPTFGIFTTATGTIPFDPTNNRIFVTFTDSTNAVRGETSVAVETQ